MPCSSIKRQAQVPVAEGLGLVAELGDELLALLVVEALERVQPVQQHAGDDIEIGLALLLGHRAPPGADLGGVAQQVGQLLGGEGDLAGVELGRLTGEELHGPAVGAGHRADGQLGLAWGRYTARNSPAAR